MLIRLIFVILIALAAPAAIWFGADAVLEDIAKAGPISAQCPAGAGADASMLCQRAMWTVITRETALLSALVLIVTIVAFTAAALWAGADRARNAMVFPWLAPLSTFIVGIMVLAQGAAIVGALYLVERQFFGQTPIWVFGFVAMGATAAGLSVIWTLLKANRDQPAHVLARAVTQEEAPELWRFVDEVAEMLNAERPDNVIVGLDPTFFAVAAPVKLPEASRMIDGESLYLSLPLMRLFTAQELAAVVGHELGHFRGEDTTYSKKFAPVYRNIGEAIASISGPSGGGATIWSQLPYAILIYFFSLFARNERRISRDREFAADQAGVAVAGAPALATSLAKVAVYAPLWNKVRHDNVARLSQGKISRNLSKVYEASARYDVSHRAISEILNLVLQTRIAHPTDSHPSISERYKNVGFAPATLTIDVLTRQGASAAALFPNLDSIEESLSLIEHKMMIRAGAATPPKDQPPQNGVLNAAYILAATLIGADGRRDTQEVHIAEGIGQELFEDFDPVTFRETFEHLDEFPDFVEVAALLSEPLSKEDKTVLHGYLLEIAAVDGAIPPEEKLLLDRAASAWRLTGWRRLLTRA